MPHILQHKDYVSEGEKKDYILGLLNYTSKPLVSRGCKVESFGGKFWMLCGNCALIQYIEVAVTYTASFVF